MNPTPGRGLRPRDDELAGLVREAQRGDERAVNAMLLRLRPWFIAVFERHVSRDAAEDSAQVVLIRMVRTLQQIDPETARAYLYETVRNRLRDLRRRSVREAKWTADAAIASVLESPATPDVVGEQDDVARAVRAGVATLSPKVRATVEASLRGLTSAEIAAELHVNRNTIRDRLRRARLILGRMLWPHADVVPGSMATHAKAVRKRRRARTG